MVGAVPCREVFYSDFGAEEHQGFTHSSSGAVVPPVPQPGKIHGINSDGAASTARPGWKSGSILALESCRDGGEQENTRCVQEVTARSAH